MELYDDPSLGKKLQEKIRNTLFQEEGRIEMSGKIMEMLNDCDKEELADIKNKYLLFQAEIFTGIDLKQRTKFYKAQGETKDSEEKWSKRFNNLDNEDLERYFLLKHGRNEDGFKKAIKAAVGKDSEKKAILDYKKFLKLKSAKGLVRVILGGLERFIAVEELIKLYDLDLDQEVKVKISEEFLRRNKGKKEGIQSLSGIVASQGLSALLQDYDDGDLQRIDPKILFISEIREGKKRIILNGKGYIKLVKKVYMKLLKKKAKNNINTPKTKY